MLSGQTYSPITLLTPQLFSRQNPFGLTIALDESGSANGELYWDEGEEEHAMSEAYFATMTFAAVSSEYNHKYRCMIVKFLRSTGWWSWPQEVFRIHYMDV